MSYYLLAPPEALRTTLKGLRYFSLDFAYLPAGFAVLPDGYAELVIYFGSPCYLATPTGRQRLPSPLLMGLLPGPVRH